MRSPQNHLADAQQRLGVANHLLGRTYLMVKDSRILLAVAKELHAAAVSATSALLEFERKNKRIPVLVNDPASRLELLEEAVAFHKLNASFSKSAKELHAIVVEHEKSPVEFAKPDRFVICDKDYQLTTVTDVSLKSSVSSLREFISAVSTIIVSEDHAGVAV
jgi:hypothetical protein